MIAPHRRNRRRSQVARQLPTATLSCRKVDRLFTWLDIFWHERGALDSSPCDRACVPWVGRREYAMRSRGAKVIVLALVATTMMAQPLYNSARHPFATLEGAHSLTGAL